MSPTAPAPDPQLAAIAAMMRELGAELEQLGETLCHDPALAARHLGALQAIDRLAQTQQALAAVLLAECRATALAGLGLEAVAGRLGGLAAAAP